MSLSNGHHQSDLASGTDLLAQLRRESYRTLQEHGEGSRQATRAQAMLTGAEQRILPDPGDAAAVTAYLQQLKSDLDWMREHAPGYGLDAFNLYYNESERLGRNLSALPEYSPDEATRFFAKVVHGTAGHAYWTGAQRFYTNEAKEVNPNRWWWKSTGKSLTAAEILSSGCGQPKCIAPEHQQVILKGQPRLYSDEAMLGKIQTVAMRLGKVPSCRDWADLEQHPTVQVYKVRFGSWNAAIALAGYKPRATEHSAEEVMQSIRYVRSKLGHWPTEREFRRFAKELTAKGLPTSQDPIRRHFGKFTTAREAAKHLSDLPGVR